MLEQIHKLLKEKQLSSSRFADEIGVQRSSVSHVLSGRNNPSLDFILKIINKYDDIDANWLLTGEGHMLKSAKRPESTFLGQHKSYQGQMTANFDEQYIKSTEDERPIKASTSEPKTDKIKPKTEKEDNGSVQEKTAEKLIVLYTDKTFEQYHSR